MPLSYVLYTNQTGVGPYNFTFPFISTAHIKVEKNGTLLTVGTDYTLSTSPTQQITLTAALVAADRLKIYRQTPGLQASPNNVALVDFNDGSVLTASDLDRNTQQLLYIVQESDDTGSGALAPSDDGSTWTAQSKRISEVADGLNAQDAVTMAQLTAATLYGGATTTPQVWAITGTGTDVYALSPIPLSTTAEMFLVEVGGVIQHPDTYTIISNGVTASIDFDANVGNGVAVNIRNLGVARNINESVTSAMIQNDAITAAKIAANAVGSSEIAADAVTTAKIPNDAVTYAKMQNVSATDRVLGRSTAGAGDVEEIICTPAGRALLDDADITAQRNTLGLGSLATKTTIVNADVDAAAQIALSKLTTIATDTVLGRSTAGAGAIESLSCTSIGRSVLAASTVQAGQAAINAIGYPVLSGTAVGRWVPLSHTVGASAGTTLLSTVNGNITAGTWAVVWFVHGGAGAYDSSHLATMAHNAQISTIPGYTAANGQKIGGFAIRIA
jgi:hypothetical protein